MITIRDEEVRTLAQTVMKKCGAGTMTAAIKLALQHEIERADETIPLMTHVREMVAKAKAKAVNPPEVNAPDARDTLWDR
ncbi:MULTISPECIES: type II toxin-antitoxin system VapB family antitoxin [unclassified Sinorhizobium]|uniref:type II toxin-antitoxin system VapB family antitoxin n=1 Tax=unclassified Sinorhizobium TaxID=2613772 RepID=UPI00352322BC